MPRRPALGRGLDALLPPDKPLRGPRPLESASGFVSDIPVDTITPNPFQPRQNFDEDALASLARSIEQLGIIQPITVRQIGHDRYEVVAGERRLRAARRVGLKSIPAFLRLANSEEMLEMALVENVQREALNPIEIALGYKQLIEECGLKQEDVAQRVGKKRSTVANFLRLLRLPPRVQIAVRDRWISMGHARALMGLPDKESRLKVFDLVLQKKLSVRQLEAYIRQKTQSKRSKQNKQPQKLPAAQALQIRKFENSLRTRFGTKVQLAYDASGKGKIEFHYFSDSELERILDLLLQRSA